MIIYQIIRSKLFPIEKHLPVILIAVCLLFHFETFATYLIKTDTGMTFITDSYWEQNDKIYFNLYGGVACFDKTCILSVAPSDKPYLFKHDEKSHITDQIETETDPQISEKAEASMQKKQTPQISEEQKQGYLEKKELLLNEIKSLKAEFVKAKQDNDQDRIDSNRKKLLEHNAAYMDLYREVVQANNGEAAPWWLNLWEDSNQN